MLFNLVYNVNRHTLYFSVLYNHQQRTQETNNRNRPNHSTQ
nr:MAG TPA: hypothetical protein [Caudoviricetes sp.]